MCVFSLRSTPVCVSVKLRKQEMSARKELLMPENAFQAVNCEHISKGE
uniref:Uncharacterized protein n=1 Tax=Anguilla anguilla TaxID=7936 RepID=A0A0E9P873_ANGAN